MGRQARIRAAQQMARDGIRRLSKGEIGPKSRCAHTKADVIGCGNPARYHVAGVGVRCFAHATEFIGRNAIDDEAGRAA